MRRVGSSRTKKRGNCRKQFVFIVGSCARFRSSGVHNSMNAKSVIEKQQEIAKENDVQKSEHKRKQEEEAKLLKIKIEEKLRRAKREGMLNIQLLVIRSLLHSSSSSKCVEKKAYNEKIQFVQMIIHDIDTIGASIVEFLCRSRRCQRVREHTRPGATLVNLVFIEESKEDEVAKQHFMEAQITQMDEGEENVVETKVQPSTEVMVEAQ